MTDPAPPPPSGSLGVKAMLRDFGCVVFIGAAIGAAYEIMQPLQLPLVKDAGTASQPAPERVAVVDLAPIVTGLASPSDVWVRLEASIVFDPKTLPHPEATAARIDDDILAYVRTVTLKQLEGPIGLETIRAELNDRAMTRSGGKVQELVLRTLVVQ